MLDARASRAQKMSLAAAIKLDRSARGTPTPDPSPQGGGEGKPLGANFDETTLLILQGTVAAFLLRRLLLPSPQGGGERKRSELILMKQRWPILPGTVAAFLLRRLLLPPQGEGRGSRA